MKAKQRKQVQRALIDAKEKLERATKALDEAKDAQAVKCRVQYYEGIVDTLNWVLTGLEA
jgi:5-bromo-4-chloroindolyl phosphate hydrolysis protein